MLYSEGVGRAAHRAYLKSSSARDREREMVDIVKKLSILYHMHICGFVCFRPNLSLGMPGNTHSRVPPLQVVVHSSSNTKSWTERQIDKAAMRCNISPAQRSSLGRGASAWSQQTATVSRVVSKSRLLHFRRDRRNGARITLASSKL